MPPTDSPNKVFEGHLENVEVLSQPGFDTSCEVQLIRERERWRDRGDGRGWDEV